MNTCQDFVQTAAQRWIRVNTMWIAIKNRDDGKKMIINTDHIDAIYPELYTIFFTGKDDPLYIDEKSNR